MTSRLRCKKDRSNLYQEPATDRAPTRGRAAAGSRWCDGDEGRAGRDADGDDADARRCDPPRLVATGRSDYARQRAVALSGVGGEAELVRGADDLGVRYGHFRRIAGVVYSTAFCEQSRIAAMNDRPNVSEKEYNWFLNHIEIEDQYAGEYIAIVDDGVVAHGKDFNAVREEAKKHGEDPLLHKVPVSGKDQVV